jgi:TldD protein
MDSASRRAEYADVRFVRSEAEHLSTRNEIVDRAESDDAEGIGVRVRVGGSWGFAAVRGTDRADAEGALERALAIAAAQPRSPGTRLTPEPPARGEHASPVEQDPFQLPLEEILALMLADDCLIIFYILLDV